jgi:hypothetical protein
MVERVCDEWRWENDRKAARDTVLAFIDERYGDKT